ncbi:MAG: glycosyltransferase family 39 protein [Anaerolineae bacterium]|nr:glycosyltransferase family 39 protein [Anaerolineae bacterium]
MTANTRHSPLHLLPAAALLVLLFFVRAHHITAQEPFIDEGYHVARASVVWDFEQHPARTANGKLLLYFWLGLFDLQPITALYVVRTAIALFALASGAGLYALGRQLGGHAVGLLALGLYAVLPLSVFFERMALADPFAAGWVILLAWRSLSFARRPVMREGALIGLLAGLAMLAKLTMGLIPLLPVAAALIYYPWFQQDKRAGDGQSKLCPYKRNLRAQQQNGHWRAHVWAWCSAYGPGLITAGVIGAALWLPVLIPAGAAWQRSDTFTLINPMNLQQLETAHPATDLWALLPQFYAYTSAGLLIACAAGTVILLFLREDRRATRQHTLFLLAWIGLLAALPAVAAKDMRSRYLMPLAGPLCLLAAYTARQVWRTPRFRRAARSALVLAGGAWLALFALPFACTAAHDPLKLDRFLSAPDATNYLSGNFAGDAMRQAADLLEQIDPPAGYIYASHGTCQALYFFTTLPVRCLDNSARPVEVTEHDVSYVVFNGHEPPFDRLGLDWKLIGTFERSRVDRDVRVWRVQNRSVGDAP